MPRHGLSLHDFLTMKYFSGSLVKVINYVNKGDVDVEFIFIGNSDEFVCEITDPSAVSSKRDSFTIKFAINTSALAVYLYSRSWDVSDSPGNKIVIIWGLLGQLKKNEDLDASQLTKWLATVMGAMPDFKNVILADDIDVDDELLFDKRAGAGAGPNVTIEKLLRNWMSVRKLK